MTDGEFLFKQTEKQTKRIARGSYNKKRGSKSKKCSLPQDNMTKGEWKKMNGEVKSYNLNAKMSKETFRAMPNDLKRIYLENMAQKGARVKDIASMIGYSEGSLYNLIGVLFRGKSAPFRRGQRNPSPEWLEFIGGDTVCEKKEEPVPEPVPVEEPEKKEEKTDPVLDLSVDFKSLSYNAIGVPEVIFLQILKVLKRGEKYRINVDVMKVNPDSIDRLPL